MTLFGWLKIYWADFNFDFARLSQIFVGFAYFSFV